MIITHNFNYECKYLYFKVPMKGFSHVNPLNMGCKVYDPPFIHFLKSHVCFSILKLPQDYGRCET